MRGSWLFFLVSRETEKSLYDFPVEFCNQVHHSCEAFWETHAYGFAIPFSLHKLAW